MAGEVDAVIVLFNNNGGVIFQHLPQAGLPEFERVWKTPTHLDFSKVSELYNLNHQQVSSVSEFDNVLTNALQEKGVRVIELLIDAEESLQAHRQYWQAVASAE